MRHHILRLLCQAGETPVSGVWISDQLGISRVAVWKQITALRAQGCPIHGSPAGYCLTDPDDLLMPACFADSLPNLDLSRKIHYYPEVDSTMDIARQLAREGTGHLSGVVAGNQTRGRGRLNRQWVSGKGGLWLTLILIPDTPPPLAYLYNFAASLAMSRALADLHHLDARVKWPNDLLLGGKKLCGLLSEMETQGDMIRFLLLGIGLNVNNDPPDGLFKATSLKQAVGHPVPRRAILIRFYREFLSVIRHMDPDTLMTAWKTRTATIGTRVRVETRHHTIEGTALDVDATGALQVLDDQGQVQPVIYGDCFHD